jgi:hypothetical protein
VLLSLAVLVHYRSPAVFSLSAWTHRIHTGFHVSRATWDVPRASRDFAYRPVTFFGAVFHRLPLSVEDPTSGSRYPIRQAGWLWLFPFRSPLLSESLLFSFPPGSEMFHFPGLAT